MKREYQEVFFGEKKKRIKRRILRKGHRSFGLNHRDLWAWRLELRELKDRYFKMKGETGF